jgi:hypothetical protein
MHEKKLQLGVKLHQLLSVAAAAVQVLNGQLQPPLQLSQAIHGQQLPHALSRLMQVLQSHAHVLPAAIVPYTAQIHDLHTVLKPHHFRELVQIT